MRHDVIVAEPHETDVVRAAEKERGGGNSSCLAERSLGLFA
jgi:hypothetical protein